MSAPIVITQYNGKEYFALERLAADAPIEDFQCRIGEYADYLREDALRAQADHVAQTWLFRERESHGTFKPRFLVCAVREVCGCLSSFLPLAKKQKNNYT